MDVVAMITELADATTAVSKEVTQHEALKNSPQMQAALVIHRIQTVLDSYRKRINNEDLDEIRKMVAAPDAGALAGGQ